MLAIVLLLSIKFNYVIVGEISVDLREKFKEAACQANYFELNVSDVI